jgi:hypothetical protein
MAKSDNPLGQHNTSTKTFSIQSCFNYFFVMHFISTETHIHVLLYFESCGYYAFLVAVNFL